MLRQSALRSLVVAASFGAALALTLADGAHAQRRRKAAAEAPPLAPFVGSVDEAKASARERNVPLLIHIILEGEEQNDEYRRTILPDAELRALCERAVVIVANNGEHELKTVREEVGDRVVERQVCSVYEMFESCEQHRQTWDPLYFEWHDPDGEMRCPQTILLSPAGEEEWRFNTANPPEVDRVRGELEDAQEKAGKGLSLEELGEVKRLLATARQADRDAAWARSLRSFQGILDAVAAGPLHDEAKSSVDEALALMKKELDAVLKLLVPGTAKEGYMQLSTLADELEGTPLEDDVRKALSSAARDKEIRDEVRAAKLELEAEDLWTESQELYRQGDDRKAESLIRRILRKKYRDTDVAKRAREKYPDIAADEDRDG
jgi:hypothetical protein